MGEGGTAEALSGDAEGSVSRYITLVPVPMSTIFSLSSVTSMERTICGVIAKTTSLC